MKKQTLALVCTFAIAACSDEKRPPQNPVGTSEVTETTTTAAPPPVPTTRNTTPPPADTMQTPAAQTPDNPATMSPEMGGGSGMGGSTMGGSGMGGSTMGGSGMGGSTMDQAPSKEKDSAITTAVRSAVVADTALSNEAKSVKISTVSGKVTLRGPVKSKEEKTAIESKAKSVTGVVDVDNQLEVKK